MKKVKIIARGNIINSETMERLNDEGLKALGSYYREVVEVADSFEIISILNEFRKRHPETEDFDFEITEVVN